ncbi:unnamed protein product (macronuclear) [Paramecium tetraurelia]|uniref:PCI domain-containing protein n=1 Tax=Paramecium tetraurelia TaxID=5888 RepID=A0BKW5_PARTE|nr:uncharacterized protein GSPATT00029813001 [Paramecium tetraurelia]CAK59182.1 unnamed protein product [Paramecium tetraurelia]|eukprot:XP_001426580.1 hypothetical protein (macronuclear) [Paramecium tetraurelia strain d4-2]
MNVETQNSNKVQQILLKQEQLIKEQKYYEYEQKILTFGSRFINQHNKDGAITLYLQASKVLVKNNQDNSGFNLATEVIKISDDLDSQSIAEIMSIYSIAQFSKLKVQFINKVLKKYPKYTDQICQQVGVDLINHNKFHLAWRYLIQLSDVNTEIQMLVKWNQQLTEQERQYNLIRYLLMQIVEQIISKLGQGLYNESVKILNELIPTTVTQEALFIHLLVKSIRIQSREAYDLVFNKFRVVVDADPIFQALYYKVGVKYFGLKEKEQQSQGIGGLLSQFFQ